MTGGELPAYTLPLNSYIKRSATCAAESATSAEEHAMRAEAEKLTESIRQSLALLRRHL